MKMTSNIKTTPKIKTTSKMKMTSSVRLLNVKMLNHLFLTKLIINLVWLLEFLLTWSFPPLDCLYQQDDISSFPPSPPLPWTHATHTWCWTSSTGSPRLCPPSPPPHPCVRWWGTQSCCGPSSTTGRGWSSHRTSPSPPPPSPPPWRGSWTQSPHWCRWGRRRRRWIWWWGRTWWWSLTRVSWSLTSPHGVLVLTDYGQRITRIGRKDQQYNTRHTTHTMGIYFRIFFNHPKGSAQISHMHVLPKMNDCFKKREKELFHVLTY